VMAGLLRSWRQTTGPTADPPSTHSLLLNR
jgi:hypothetical protein